MKTLYVFPTKRKCNKNCSFCITKREMIDDDTQEFLRVEDLQNNLGEIDNLIKKYNIEEIEFTGGGEPTLNENFNKISLFFHQNWSHLKFSLYTNGRKLIDFRNAMDEINISMNIEDLIDPDIRSALCLSLEHYRKRTPRLRTRTYIDMNKSHSNLFKFFEFAKTELIKIPVNQIVLGKDFHTEDSLFNYLNENSKIQKFLIDNDLYRLFKIDENDAQCTIRPIIYSDGSISKNWKPFMIPEQVIQSSVKKILTETNPGYHINHIPKGEYGTFEKIREEFLELEDSINQNIKVMTILELSDLLGAIEGYVEYNLKDISLNDLLEMNKMTKRAFLNGHRKN